MKTYYSSLPRNSQCLLSLVVLVGFAFASHAEVRFSQESYRQPFGLDKTTLTLVRADGLDSPLEVQFRTLDGTAIAGEHYVSQSNSIAFLTGESDADIVIPLITLPGGEGDRDFVVQAADSFESPSWQIEASITLVDTLHPGGFDPTFDAGRISGGVPDTGGNTYVEDFVVLPDGKVIIGGHISSVQGQVRDAIARLHPDGTLDETFVSASPDQSALGGDVHHIRLLPDGKLIAWWNTPHRVNADGTLDHSFPHIMCVEVMDDGKIIGFLGDGNGGFSFPSPLRRFLPDGELDSSFQVVESTSDTGVTSVTILDDGKMLLFFYESDPSRGIGPNLLLKRYLSDGTRDVDFTEVTLGEATQRLAVSVLPDGKILIGGRFKSVNGNSSPSLVRLNADGTRDPTFDAGPLLTLPSSAPVSNGGDAFILAIATQADGKILVGGRFNDDDDARLRVGLVRLNPDGSYDKSFDVGAGVGKGVVDYDEEYSFCWINNIEIQPDEKILVSGGFGSFDGFGNGHIVRLFGNPWLRIGPAVVSQEGQIRLPVKGADGQCVCVQRSTDLVHWEDWKTMTLDADGCELADDIASGQQMFYRVVEDHSMPANEP